MPNPHCAMQETTPGADCALSVRGLSHVYAGGRVALDGVSFDVRAGEVFGVLGPNGGGKTTLFKVMATLIKPTGTGAGCVHVFGRDVVREAAAVRAMMGVVFQHPSLDDKLTARENMLHHGHLYAMRGRELAEAIEMGLGRFGLAARADERVERFSGGMRRRVELAKAMLHRPRVLVMDEPATGLDPAARRELWDAIATLRAETGVTVVLTTHLMDEAARCDRLAILSQGRLVALDTPAALTGRIGGDVVQLELAGDNGEVAGVAGEIGARFGPWAEGGEPTVVTGNVIRCERPDGAALVAQLSQAYGERVTRMSVGRPTLEDVFVHLTGEALDGGEGG